VGCGERRSTSRGRCPPVRCSECTLWPFKSTLGLLLPLMPVALALPFMQVALLPLPPPLALARALALRVALLRYLASLLGEARPFPCW
jgi:hypothetical protein